MNTTEQQTLTLLRSALWQEAPDTATFPEDTDWGAILQCAFKQSIQGLVASAIVELADSPGANISEQVVQACLRIQFATIGTSDLVSKVATKVMEKLDRAGLYAVLIKGQGVARYYPHPQLRAAGDVDVYLSVDDTVKAGELLKNCADRQEVLHYHPKHLNLEIDGIEVELHRYMANLDDKTSYQAMQKWADQLRESKAWQRADIGPAEVNVPTPEFDAIFVFYHLWHHLLHGGVGLRQFCDWAMILHHYHGRLNIDVVRSVLKRTHLMHEWRVLGCILVELLRLPEEELPFYRRRHRWLSRVYAKRILEGGNFGFYGEEAYENFMKRNTYKGVMHRLYTLQYFLRRDFYSMLLSPRATWNYMRSFYHF